MNRLARFLAQSGETRSAMLHAAWHLSVARLLLALRGSAAVRKLIASHRSDSGDAAAARVHADALLRVADRLPFRTTCLERSLALHRMLRSRGIDATIRIGVQRHEDRSLAAHAWVELRGVVLLDDDVTAWAPFDPTPPSRDNERTLT